MNNQSFNQTILSHFEWTPSDEQKELFTALEMFVRTPSPYPVFIIRGYAGTGKTSALAAFINALADYKVTTTLLAPTGRAAKVLSNKAKKDAFTIHKKIYRRKSKADPTSGISLQPNLSKNTVFIVDECSMIGDYTLGNDGMIGSRNLLEDLFEHVFSADGCKLILMGDEGQLPPVGSDYSPALNKDYLTNHYPRLELSEYTLSHVLRQSNDSEILRNATILRSTNWVDYPKFDIQQNSDLQRINGMDLQEFLESSYSRSGMDETIVITRSNKQANAYNQQIRSRILWYEEELSSGDFLMVVRNNYHWLGDDSKIGFIANGELIRLVRLIKYEEFYGFRFAKVIVNFLDYSDVGDVELIIHTESLTIDAPSMSRERMKELFYEIEKDYGHIRNKKERYDAILSDPYFNALQVKYAYAVTCHKSQGGQWKEVFIDQGFINEEVLNSSYYRWLYTALTRATEHVYLVNFADEFFID